MCVCACAWACMRVGMRARACVWVRVRACVRVRVCVGASRRDDPPRLGRALLGHAGVLYTFTVELRLGQQGI